MNRIDLVIQNAEGPTLLDLGAVQHDIEKTQQTQWLHDHLRENFDQVIGVDILKDEVRMLNSDGYDMRHANVETMDLDIDADTIVAGELIEHIANPGLMLERAREHLKPNARIVLTTPNPWAIVHLRRWLTRSFSINEEHVAWYGPMVLKQLLERYGFPVVNCQTTSRDHKGLTGVAQKLGSDVFGGTTWVCVAIKQ